MAYARNDQEDEWRRSSNTSTVDSTAASGSEFSKDLTPASSTSPETNIAKTDEELDTEMTEVSPPRSSSPVKQEENVSPPRPAPSLSTANAQKPSVQAIVTHLEMVVRTFIAAINERTLHPSNPIHDDFDPRFSATSPPPWPPEQEDYQSYIGRLNAITLASPSYSMDNLVLDTHVYKNGHAGVFVTFEVNGVPPGMKRLTVAIFRFRKRDGRWRCFTVEEVIHGGGGITH